MRKRVTILLNGNGGHRSQMQRLFDKIKEVDDAPYINITEPKGGINGVEKTYYTFALRDKHSKAKSILLAPITLIHYIFLMLRCFMTYKIAGVITTGPGICIPFSLFFKLFRVPIVYIETWSRFRTKSFSGRIMYRFANKFYVQNESLLELYPDAIYSGLL